MTMSQKTRDELVQMNRNERAEERCIIMKRLNSNAKELTKLIDDAIRDSREEIKEFESDRFNILKYNMLLEVVSYDERNHYRCSLSDTHPELAEFDKESNRQSKEILLMK